ncbi:MAG: DUF6178 family protein [Nitrospirota bacterium]
MKEDDNKPSPSAQQALVAKVQRLASLPAKTRVAEILADPEAKELIQAMAEEELYLTFKEVGDHEGFPLLELASPEQRQYVTDLDFWQKDELNRERALHWIALLQETGPSALKTWLRESEPELICLILKKWVQVHTWDRQQDSEEPPFFSLDQVYYLEFTEPLREKALKRFLTSLAEDDLAFYHQILENVAWHTDADFEDYLLHFRTARLAEKGFPDLEEALAVYAPLSPERFRNMEATGTLFTPTPPEDARLAPEYALVRQPEGTLFRAATGEVRKPRNLERIKRELAALANRVLVADGKTPDDPAALEASLAGVAGYVSIGLERLVSWDMPRAGELLARAPLASLFQVGFDGVLKVQRQAERQVTAWLRDCGLSLAFLDEPWNAEIQGLLWKRPKLHRGGRAGEPLYEEFASLRQLRELERTVDTAHLVGSVLLALMPAASWAAGWRSLEHRDPEKAPLLTWRTVFLSAFARGVLSSRFVPERLTMEEVRRFLETIWEPNRRPSRVAAPWKFELSTWLGGLARRSPGEMEPLVANLSATIEGELGEATPAELERKYLETLFLLVEEEGAG